MNRQGPLTTTYTAPPSCSTDFAYVQVGSSFVDSESNSTSIMALGVSCGLAWPTIGSCLPSGAKLDEDYSAIDTDEVQMYYTLGYYSPGLACPSGWDTVGVATKSEGGNITSSGPGFTNPTPIDEMDTVYVDNVGSNVLLAGMDEGDAAVLCCPRCVSQSYAVFSRRHCRANETRDQLVLCRLLGSMLVDCANL